MKINKTLMHGECVNKFTIGPIKDDSVVVMETVPEGPEDDRHDVLYPAVFNSIGDIGYYLKYMGIDIVGIDHIQDVTIIKTRNDDDDLIVKPTNISYFDKGWIQIEIDMEE